MKDLGLGRLASADERDKNFPVKLLLSAKASERTSRYWNASGWWGDQGLTSECVGYSWAHWLEDGPVTQPGKGPIVHPSLIYREAQKIDEWVGENYDGTSVRAGAKVLQSKGFIKEYRWAFDLDTVVQTILEKGPVLAGTNWYYQMFFPSETGIISVGRGLAGGHAYVLNGVNTKTKQFRIKNSWGREWGKDGYAYISFSDMERLIYEDGEFCLAIENKAGVFTTNEIKHKIKDRLSQETLLAIAEGERIRKLLK